MERKKGDVLKSDFRCFFRQLLLRAENSQPRLLEIQCAVASGSLRQECSLLRTCLTTQQNPGIQVKSYFRGLLGRVSNTSLKVAVSEAPNFFLLIKDFIFL